MPYSERLETLKVLHLGHYAVNKMQLGSTPVVPWHTVATDLFETKNSKYLLIVDYYSRFPILCKLSSTTSRVLIQEMKAVFTELGVPSVIVSDGGLQYTATEFQDFTKHWQIEHRLSSPRALSLMAWWSILCRL